jgi:protein SCO1
MFRNNKKWVVYALLVLAFVFSTAYLLSLNQKTPKLSPLPYYHFDLAKNEVYSSSLPEHQVGSFSFTDQRGQNVSSESLGKTVYVTDFFFVQCPGICKQMSHELQKVYHTFEDEPRVKILSHTSKPEEDSVEALMGYAQMYGVKDHGKWLFVTGEKPVLYRMAREQYFLVNDEGDGGEDDFIHTERMALVDVNRRIRGYYDGTDSADTKRLLADIKELLEEQF